MSSNLLSVTEQLAEILREGIRSGRWLGELPGRQRLSRELGASCSTLTRALDLLEEEGLLETQGSGKKRKITGKTPASRSTFRITILPFSTTINDPPEVFELYHQLTTRGYDVSFAMKGLMELHMDLDRVIKLVEGTDTDAWIIISGSKPILKWFAEQKTPAFGFAGGIAGVNIAGTGFDACASMRAATKKLIELGHKRIVFIDYDHTRVPTMGIIEQAFLEEMAAHGITTGPFNSPKWTCGAEGLTRCLQTLFTHTPPTALITSSLAMNTTVKSFLSERRLCIPKDVSLLEASGLIPSGWEIPLLAHFIADTKKLLTPTLRWIEQVANGNNNQNQTILHTEFDEGGTIAPPPSSKVR